MTESQIHIVIADDQPDNLLVLEDLLDSRHLVHAFDSGDAALRYLLGNGAADLVLLDVVMPGLDGFEVCRRLKAAPNTRHIPVIFLTSLDSDTDEAFALSLGAEDFIHKPFSPAVVLSRVDTHLRLSRTTRLLRERNEDMERLTASTSGIGIWDYDLDHERMVWSDEMCRLYGIAPAEFGGTRGDWIARLHPNDRDLVEASCRAAVTEGETLTTEFRIVRSDGHLRYMKITGIVRRNSRGKAVKILGNCWDVTKYRQAIELANAAKAEAEAANTAKSTFLAKMSHEFRTPLNAVMGFSQLLRAGETVQERREYLDIICDSSKNLVHMVQDVLDFARIETGKIRVENRSFDLRKELAAIVALFQLEAGRKGLTVVLQTAPEIPFRLRGDPQLLRQVLVNLVGNAIKFTDHGQIGVIATGHERSSDGTRTTILFEVSDTGPGIKPENRERIFEMFEQEDNSSTRRFDGAGLGLTISRNLVSLLGGRMWLNSEIGVGSRFSFTAPFETLTGRVFEKAALLNLTRPTLDRGRHLLVVEDDPFNRRLLVALLEPLGYQLATAGDGDTALKMLGKQSFDLILMDIQLPQRSGIDLTRAIRSGAIEGCRPDIPIVALTAYAVRGDKEGLLESGIDDYLAKPYDVSQLIEIISDNCG